MNYVKIIFMVLGAIYVPMRPILKKAVDDPNAEWDDRLMATSDALFGWKGEK